MHEARLLWRTQATRNVFPSHSNWFLDLRSVVLDCTMARAYPPNTCSRCAFQIGVSSGDQLCSSDRIDRIYSTCTSRIALARTAGKDVILQGALSTCLSAKCSTEELNVPTRSSKAKMTDSAALMRAFSARSCGRGNLGFCKCAALHAALVGARLAIWAQGHRIMQKVCRRQEITLI